MKKKYVESNHLKQVCWIQRLWVSNPTVAPKNIKKIHRILVKYRKVKVCIIFCKSILLRENSVQSWYRVCSLHSKDKSATSWVGSEGWEPTKATKSATVDWQSYGVNIWGLHYIILNDNLKKRKLSVTNIICLYFTYEPANRMTIGFADDFAIVIGQSTWRKSRRW